MKRFLLQIVIFILIGLLSIAISFCFPDNSSVQDMNYSILDKQRMLRVVATPRLILVGGSNLSFGVNSEMLQDSLGVSVVNAGLHAGYGLKFILDFVKPYIRPGDVVLLSPEYSQFYGTLAFGEIALLQAMDVYPKYYKRLNMSQISSLLPHVTSFSIQKAKKFATLSFHSKVDTGVYERRSFNNHGDAVAHWRLPNEKFEWEHLEKTVNDDAFKLVSEFETYVIEAGATLCITFPCYNMSSYRISEQKVLTVEKRLQEMKSKLIGNSSRYCFPDSLFFNTSYHLNKKGIELRTQLLVEDLKTSYDFEMIAELRK